MDEPRERRSIESAEPAFEFTGGRLCLDFSNTTRHKPNAEPREDLGSYAGFVSWSEQAGVLSEEDARRTLRQADSHPRQAQAALRQACSLRGAIYATFSSIAARRAPPPPEFALLSKAASKAWSHLRITGRKGAFAWELEPLSDGISLTRPLWAIARSAADLLTSSDLSSVRECALETCAWLFVDNSRNQKRRWCDMKICGNRSKARRHYRRTRARPR